MFVLQLLCKAAVCAALAVLILYIAFRRPPPRQPSKKEDLEDDSPVEM